MPDLRHRLVEALGAARRVVVLTGAGVSAESGIRTFRDSMEGLWKDFDPARLATPEAFKADPELVTRWYDWRRLGCLAAEPNPGHFALADLERHMIDRSGDRGSSQQSVAGIVPESDEEWGGASASRKDQRRTRIEPNGVGGEGRAAAARLDPGSGSHPVAEPASHPRDGRGNRSPTDLGFDPSSDSTSDLGNDSSRDRFPAFLLATQNVDRLHQKAGSVRVVELHGSIITWRCTRTGRAFSPRPEPFSEYPPLSPWGDEPRAETVFGGGPGSEQAILRPGVVWFGEPLPENALLTTGLAAELCDVFISIGTSAVVYPAAGLIEVAAANGAFTAEINFDETPISRRVDCSIRAKSGEVLPGIVREAFGDG